MNLQRALLTLFKATVFAILFIDLVQPTWLAYHSTTLIDYSAAESLLLRTRDIPMDFKMPTREEQEEKISFWKDKIVGKTLVDDLSEEKDTHVVEQPRDKESEEQTSEVANQEEPSDQNVLLSSLPTPLRVIKPGSRVTRDLRPYRMNVMCSKEGVITDIKFF